MIKSMTGYGRGQVLIHDKGILVEIKSVNHRYFDFSCKVPRMFGFLEEKLKTAVSSFVSRGKIDVFVSIDLTESETLGVKLNTKLLESYRRVFSQLKNDYNIADDVSVLGVCKIPDICIVEKEQIDEESIWKDVYEALQLAGESFLQMRSQEGARLYHDLVARGEYILRQVEKIDLKSPQIEEEYTKRLTDRVTQMLGNSVDESRILTEVAIFCEKVSITEEIVRLRSHLSQYSSMLLCDEPIGRKLDFLIQEMNREINTIGSKSSDVEITRIVVDIKSEIEKIREQIQNIE
jgi:uncharacterized protein (TIGR00255 family)